MRTYLIIALALLLASVRTVAQEPTDVSKMDYAVYCEHTYAQAGSTAELYIKLKTGMVCGAFATVLSYCSAGLLSSMPWTWNPSWPEYIWNSQILCIR